MGRTSLSIACLVKVPICGPNMKVVDDCRRPFGVDCAMTGREEVKNGGISKMEIEKVRISNVTASYKALFFPTVINGHTSIYLRFVTTS